ncbi:MAG: succinyl-diaminopimelate desuccinylase [Acidimicrobiales bacterium]|nr:succinyl-diaminopimelate desuccinylase [Hyphomonadaceae bacterium]RZV42065.1 MAG: succinyl-diaminopimelate desuccinylase [Acidimicrobiales bacterium]
MSKPNVINPVQFAADLIRCPSVTPKNAGALDLLQDALEELGFNCTRYPFEEVDNLYARLGTKAPNFCYAGHTDVVPVGDASDWEHEPFGGLIRDGILWGRGAADMKGGIASFVAAVSANLADGWTPNGSISFLITGDEEGPAVNGTVKVLDAIAARGEKIDHCLVGEPTNPNTLGAMIKIGRRGSLNGVITATGTQGHVAYPDLAGNPVPALLKVLTALTTKKLDDGNENFQPSNLEVTSIDVNNPAHNVIPAAATAKFNIRFNTEHDGQDLLRWINREIAGVEKEFEGKIEADLRLPGLPFLTTPCRFTDTLSEAVKSVTGRKPELSTSGGTSDARFITNFAPVVEFGLIGATIHKVNEHARVEDIENLTEIYKRLLIAYFAS